MKEALFYDKAAGGKADCNLCARRCRGITDGNVGFCGVRKNVKGKLYSLVYGKACSVAVDPIEKKPLFHFAPGTECLSIATVGCNFKCLHCQNWEISQDYGEIKDGTLSPEMVIDMARNHGVKGIAYTYTEPTVFYEYAYDTMKLARKAGLYNVWVSNGYTTPEAIKHASKYLDAVNVDMKGNDRFYREVCMVPGIEPVYDALLAYKKHNVFLEITNLVIPGYNDSEKDVKSLVNWIHDNLGPQTPLHFSAFHPQHMMGDARPTPLKTLEKCHEVAKKAGMKWVYLGNLRTDHENTLCSKCGNVVIERQGYHTNYNGDRCSKCRSLVPIAGKEYI